VTWRLLRVVAFAAALCSTCAPPAARIPRVLLICVDTLRADRLGAYGYTARAVSPEIDALARDSILFERCISAAPWTTPSVMSLFTACYPTTHGMTASFVELRHHIERGDSVPTVDPSLPRLATVLRDAGYATAAFTGGLTVSPELGFGAGFDRYDTSSFKLGEENVQPMLDWIDAHADQPAFVFFHTFEVHEPYLDTTYLDEVLSGEPLEQVRQQFGKLAAKARASDPNLAELGVLSTLAHESPFIADAPRAALYEALYCGGIFSVDRWIGRLVTHLKARGLYDDTLIVLTSDHGEEFADHHPNAVTGAHGHTLYDELVHVPLIVKLPRQERAGTRVAPLVRSVDVMPTVLDVLGLPAPVGPSGRSLRNTWSGRPAEERVAFSESLSLLSEMKAARTERYTYIVNIPAEAVVARGRSALPDANAPRELYDRTLDPGELSSLLDPPVDPADEATARALGEHLRAFLTSRPRPPGSVKLSPELLEDLRALGYVETER
jgi:arylsulfatase A-like enzyme